MRASLVRRCASNGPLASVASAFARSGVHGAVSPVAAAMGYNDNAAAVGAGAVAPLVMVLLLPRPSFAAAAIAAARNGMALAVPAAAHPGALEGSARRLAQALAGDSVSS